MSCLSLFGKLGWLLFLELKFFVFEFFIWDFVVFLFYLLFKSIEPLWCLALDLIELEVSNLPSR